MTIDDYFSGYPVARSLFEVVKQEIDALGGASIRASKSQVAFRGRKNFAVVWVPAKYLEPPVAPLVLTFSFPRRVASARWKEVTQVAPRRFTHHLELHEAGDLDAEVREWLRRARQDAQPSSQRTPTE
jgi:hypothetical protein